MRRLRPEEHECHGYGVMSECSYRPKRLSGQAVVSNQAGLAPYAEALSAANAARLLRDPGFAVETMLRDVTR